MTKHSGHEISADGSRLVHVCQHVADLDHAERDPASDSPDHSHADPWRWEKCVSFLWYGDGHGLHLMSPLSIYAHVAYG